MRSRPGLRRWALAGVAGLLGGPAVALATGGPAGAEAVRSVVAKASAQGVRAVYTIPDYVVVSQIFDGGGPVTPGISGGAGALRFASVTPRSETVLGPGDARPVTTTSLVVEGARGAGHAVTVDGGGVHAEGQAVPAPLGQGAGSDNQFLGQLGLSARIVPAGVPRGADALVITSSQTFPAPGNPKGTLVMTFGGAASEITVGSPDGPSLDTPAADAGATPAPGGTTPSGASPGATEVAGASPLTSSAVLARSGVGPGAIGSGPVGAGLPIDGPAPHAPTAGAAPGAGEIAAPASGPVAVRGASRLGVQADLAENGALDSLLGLGGGGQWGG